MKLKTKDIITILVFAILLVSWVIIQTHLKSTPQIVLVLIGFITFGFSFFNKKIVFKIPFYLILGIIIMCFLFGIILFIMGIFFPNAGKVEINGQLYPTNPIVQILLGSVIISIITVLLLLFYLFKWKTDIQIERYFVLIFTLLTLMMWGIYEV